MECGYLLSVLPFVILELGIVLLHYARVVGAVVQPLGGRPDAVHLPWCELPGMTHARRVAHARPYEPADRFGVLSH